MAIYEASFVFLSAICLLLYLFTTNSSQQSAAGGDGSFRKFQRKYLTVYLMAQGRGCLFQLITVRSFHGEGLCRGQSETTILYSKLRLDRIGSSPWSIMWVVPLGDACCSEIIILFVNSLNTASFSSLMWTVLTYIRIILIIKVIYQLFLGCSIWIGLPIMSRATTWSLNDLTD